MRELSGLYLEYVCGEHPGKEFIYRIFRQFIKVLTNLFICTCDLFEDQRNLRMLYNIIMVPLIKKK